MNRLTPGFGAAILASWVLTIQPAIAQPMAGVIEGRWGGDRLQLTLDAKGGRVELDCAGGSIAVPVRPNANGEFSATGTFEQYHPGPQRAEGSPAAAKAHYIGEVKGGSLILTIATAGADAPLTFHLRQGANVKLVRCL